MKIYKIRHSMNTKYISIRANSDYEAAEKWARRNGYADIEAYAAANGCTISETVTGVVGRRADA